MSAIFLNGQEASKRSRLIVSTVLRTQHVRYWLISSWGLALWPLVGFVAAAAWCLMTLASAGWLRSYLEKFLSRRGGELPRYYPLFSMFFTGFWAMGPLMAWSSDNAFGQAAALLMMAVGYNLSFTQLGRTPKQALVVTSPYTLLAVWFAWTLVGTPALAPFLFGVVMLYGQLGVGVIYVKATHERLREHEEQQERLIRQLEESRDRADAASRAKSTFLGVVSHELRTPMNGVLGAAQLLDSTPLNDVQQEYVGIIRDSGGALLTLLNDILDLTKIEADRMALEKVEVDLPGVIERVGRTWRARAGEKDLAYGWTLDEATPDIVVGDATRLGQIVHNLLSNAIKFTDAGEVRLDVSCVREADDRARVRIEVRDTGPGITAEDLERLFQPFSQVDNSVTRRCGGTGLGLAISRNLARLMGGELSAESEPGVGSRFTLELPLEVRAWTRQVAAPLEREAEAAAAALSVLVVEDHPVNRKIVETFLVMAGHDCVSAENGQEALDAAARQAFDLVLMDVNMPVMDGLTAVRRLRADEGPNQAAPIVMLSASARKEDHDAGLKAGADAYLDKPLVLKDLAAMLERAASGRLALREAA